MLQKFLVLVIIMLIDNCRGDFAWIRTKCCANFQFPWSSFDHNPIMWPVPIGKVNRNY